LIIEGILRVGDINFSQAREYGASMQITRLRRRNVTNIVAASHPVRSADEFDEPDIRSKHSRDSRALRSLADTIATRLYYSYYGDQRAYRERYPAVRIFTRVSSRGCVQRVTKTFQVRPTIPRA